jgi:hypothetical protein
MKIIALIVFWAFVIGGGVIGYKQADRYKKFEDMTLGALMGIFIGSLFIGISIAIYHLI